ncbi:MAG: diguanylate cyclase, partial [Deltaproteobacteria bacterium]|nr:diguanylate cyclase [Deltaproteobacteria bacterium]
KASKAFLGFVSGLRKKIEDDFRYINETFRVLLEQIKELERSLTKEFGGDERLKEIEYFEMNINQEMGSIVRSFDIHTTIDEIKAVVMEKIKKIKEVVSLRKKREMERARAAKENIERLQQRIAEAERQAQEMSKKAEELQTVAMKDGLTGLYNRKAFALRIESVLRRTKDSGEPFSLIMFDVDGFKEINDTFGHVAGDKVLKKVAECLRSSFRENDFIARYGGDEFAVIIEKMGRPMALERLGAFKKNLSKIRFVSHKKGEIRLTVSSGVAESFQGDTAEAVIERADQEMYKEKNKKKQNVTL